MDSEKQAPDKANKWKGFQRCLAIGIFCVCLAGLIAGVYYVVIVVDRDLDGKFEY